MPEKRGFSYPLQIENGSLRTSIDFELVREHILSVLETRPYERVMNSDYGLSDLVFEVLNPELINSKIYRAIIEQVDEISELRVTGNHSGGEEGVYAVSIRYKVNGIPQAPINFKLLR